MKIQTPCPRADSGPRGVSPAGFYKVRMERGAELLVGIQGTGSAFCQLQGIDTGRQGQEGAVLN